MSGQTSAHAALYERANPTTGNEITYAIFRLLRRLAEKVRSYPVILTYAGIAVQQLQLLYLVFSPLSSHELPFFRELACAVSVFSAPLSDDSLGTVSYRVYTALACTFASISMVAFSMFFLGVFLPSISELRVFLQILRALMESIAGWLFLPLMHLYLGGMMCTKDASDESVVIHFPTHACSEGFRTANVVVGSFGLFTTFAIALVMCWIFDFGAESKHPLARPHGYYDIFALLTKTVLVILYHIVRTMFDSFKAYSILAVIAFAAMLLCLCLLMPYYAQTTAAVLGMSLACCCYLGIIDTMGSFNVNYFTLTSPEVRSMVTFSTVPFAAALGWVLAGIRNDLALQSYLRLLRTSGVVPEHVAKVPLPRSHRRSQWHVASPVLTAIEKEMRQEMCIEEYVVGQGPAKGAHVGGGGDADDEELARQQGAAVRNGFALYGTDTQRGGSGGGYGGFEGMSNAPCKGQFELMLPLVSRMYMPTDVELATRFLRRYDQSTGDTVRISSLQLGYALNILSESLGYFKNSPYVTIALASFLFQYCDRAEAVIDLVDEMARHHGGKMTHVDFMVHFKAYRLWYNAKEALGYRDSVHLVALQRARTHHRQALSTTKRFWQTLLNYHAGSQIDLILISDKLAKQRHDALEAYRVALTTSPDDTVTLRSIAEFVEEVLGSKGVAQEIHFAVDDIEERRKSRKKLNHRQRGGSGALAPTLGTGALAAYSTGSSSRGTSLNTAQNDALVGLRFDEIMAATRLDETTRNVSHTWEHSFFLVLLYICVAVCFASSAVILALSVVHANALVRNTNAIQTAHSARADGFRGMYYAEKASMYFYENNCEENGQACSTQSDFLELLQNVSEAEMDMRVKNNYLTWGRYSPAYGSTTYRFLTESLLGIHFNPQDNDDYYFWGTMTEQSGQEVGIYSLLRTQLQSTNMPQSMWTAMTLVSGSFSEFVNRMRDASPLYRHYLQFIVDDGGLVFLEAYQSLSRALTVDIMETRKNIILGLILCVCATCFGVAVGLASFYISICWVAKNRVLLTGVFSFIPSLFLEQLHDETADRLENFDRRIGGAIPSPDDDDSLSLQLGGDDKRNDRHNNSHYYGGVRPKSADDMARDGSDDVSSEVTSQASAAAANRHFVRALLDGVPKRSCLKKRATRGLLAPRRADGGKAVPGAASATPPPETRTVHFALAPEELEEEDKPKPRLFEPAAVVDGTGEDIIADFEKNLMEMDKEARKEREQAERRHDSSASDRMLTNTYRIIWCDIKEKLAAWSRKVSMFNCLYTGILIPLMLAAMVVVMCLAIVTMKDMKHSQPVVTAGLSEMLTLYSHVSDFDKFDVQVATFINFFDPGYANEVAEYVFVKSAYNNMLTVLQRQYDPTITQSIALVSALRIATLRAVASDTIYCSLAARAGHAMKEFDLFGHPYLAIYFYTREEANAIFLAKEYPKIFAEPHQYTIALLEDMPLTGEKMHMTVLTLHRRARFFEDAENIRDTLSVASQSTDEKLRASMQVIVSKASHMLIGTTIVCALFIAAGITAFIIAVRYKLSVALRVLLAAAVVCAIIVLINSCLLEKKIRLKMTDVSIMQMALESVSMYQTNVFSRIARLQQYLHTDMMLCDSVLDELFNMTPDHINSYLNIQKYFPSTTSAINTLQRLDRTLWNIQQVALFLAYVSKAKNSNMPNVMPPSPPFISTYNYLKEDTYEYDKDHFGDDHPTLMYSRPELDVQHDLYQLEDMARFAVFGLRGAHYALATLAANDDVFDMVEAATLRTMTRKDKAEHAQIIVVVIFSAIGTVLMVIAAILPLLRFVFKIAEGTHRRGLVRATVKASYSDILRSVIVAAVMCVLIGVVQFLLMMLPMSLDEQAASLAAKSSVRVAGVYQSLARNVYAVHALHGNSPPLAATTTTDMVTSTNVLKNTRTYLYFRDGASKDGYGNVATLNNEQREAMFSTTNGTSADIELQNWIAINDALVDFSARVDLATGFVLANPTPQDLFVVNPDDMDWTDQRLKELEAAAGSLVDHFELSDELYRKDIQHRAWAPVIPAAIFFAIVSICSAFMIFYILPWFLRLISREEQETRVLLKAIPKAAFDAVPSIALFIDSGIIEDEADHAKLLATYSLSPNVRRFIQEWQARNSEESTARPVEEICRAYLELQSTGNSGIVFCDSHGTILFTNSTLLEWTRYDNLASRNVGILMPPSVAAVHNQFLYRYMQAPRVGGPRTIDVMACTADGEPLHLLVCKAEAPANDGTMYFVAELFRHSGNDVAMKTKRKMAGGFLDGDDEDSMSEGSKKGKKRHNKEDAHTAAIKK